MFCTKCKCCSAMWWSGFFALAALMHIIRLIVRLDLQFGTFVVPMGASIGVASVGALLSFIFFKKGCESCGCASK